MSTRSRLAFCMSALVLLILNISLCVDPRRPAPPAPVGRVEVTRLAVPGASSVKIYPIRGSQTGSTSVVVWIEE